jgi:hypothetical protein
MSFVVSSAPLRALRVTRVRPAASASTYVPLGMAVGRLATNVHAIAAKPAKPRTILKARGMWASGKIEAATAATPKPMLPMRRLRVGGGTGTFASNSGQRWSERDVNEGRRIPVTP